MAVIHPFFAIDCDMLLQGRAGHSLGFQSEYRLCVCILTRNHWPEYLSIPPTMRRLHQLYGCSDAYSSFRPAYYFPIYAVGMFHWVASFPPRL